MGDINLVDIPIYIINFCVTLTLLYILLYKPLSKFLSERKERIENSLSNAETVQKEAEGILQEAKNELAIAYEKGRQLSHEAIDNAMQDAENIIDNAQEKADETILRAREQMEAERQASLERSFTDIVSFAGGLASRILVREVTIEDNREIVDRFFSEKAEENKEKQASPSNNLTAEKEEMGS